jgi:Protein of unknown function (DUF4197)
MRILLVFMFVSTAWAQINLGDILNKAGEVMKGRNAGALSDSKIVAGLTDALRVGTSNAVAKTGKPDGFLKNRAIKILLPEKLRSVASGARMLGMGGRVDELEVGMNRAAEQATPRAKEIFFDALKRMTFDDARQILNGGDTAATDYFKRQSSADLTEAFTPIVRDTMEKVGVIRQYNQLLKSAPGGQVIAGRYDLNQYVVGRTLDGLFYMLGQEEKKIRENPAARTTAILREVFGATR